MPRPEKAIKNEKEIWEGVWSLSPKDEPHVTEEKYKAFERDYSSSVDNAIEEEDQKKREAEEKHKNFVVTH